ncbi:MAG: DinB family protein [Proteobacteria bacterium]|nr:DinB family protein [Pseudomonadota bacterium]
MSEFIQITHEIMSIVEEWEPKLFSLAEDTITKRRNSQKRNIKQILGHLIDSASNNTHRIIHLQYQQSPCQYPNYGSNGNNDRWISIQDYQNENWDTIVKLWKYSNLHIVHVINNVDASKLDNKWQYSDVKFISLRENIINYLQHLKLHIGEINELNS